MIIEFKFGQRINKWELAEELGRPFRIIRQPYEQILTDEAGNEINQQYGLQIELDGDFTLADETALKRICENHCPYKSDLELEADTAKQ